MKASLWVRVAAVLVLMHAVLHTVGGVFGKVQPGPEAVAVAAMKANRFDALGVSRTFWDFYMGMGLAVTIFLTAEAVVLWLVARLVARHGAELRPVLMAFAVGYLAFAMNSARYFFAAPVVVEALIGACLLAAAALAKKAGISEASH